MRFSNTENHINRLSSRIGGICLLAAVLGASLSGARGQEKEENMLSVTLDWHSVQVEPRPGSERLVTREEFPIERRVRCITNSTENRSVPMATASLSWLTRQTANGWSMSASALENLCPSLPATRETSTISS